jgi:NitT/TauT family transport system permease protein
MSASPSLGKRLRNLLMPLVTLAIILWLWQFAIYWFEVPRYQAPSPMAVATAFGKRGPEILAATLVTGMSAATGFAASLVLGTTLAFLFSQSTWLRASLMPYALFMQTVPVVAIAPIVISLVGYGPRSVALIAMMISLFPMIASGTAGFLAVDADLLDLFRLHRASGLKTLIKLRIPSAIPHLVTGAKTAAGLAVIGAIVGELFAGATYKWKGLALLIDGALQRLHSDLLFAAVIASTLLGLSFYLGVTLLERTALRRWTRRKREGSGSP